MEKFLLLFRNSVVEETAFQEMSPEAMQAEIAKWNTWIGGIAAQGKLISTEGLYPTGKMMANAGTLVTDGPYTESKELVGGFMLLHAADYAEARRAQALGRTREIGRVGEIKGLGAEDGLDRLADIEGFLERAVVGHAGGPAHIGESAGDIAKREGRRDGEPICVKVFGQSRLRAAGEFRRDTGGIGTQHAAANARISDGGDREREARVPGERAGPAPSLQRDVGEDIGSHRRGDPDRMRHDEALRDVALGERALGCEVVRILHRRHKGVLAKDAARGIVDEL